MNEVTNTINYTATNSFENDWLDSISVTADSGEDSSLFYVSFLSRSEGVTVASYYFECASLADVASVAKQLADKERNVWLNGQMVIIGSTVAAWLN